MEDEPEARHADEIASEHAQALHRFYAEHLNPYLNYHRPCAQADIETDHKGRQRRRYRRYQSR